MVFCRYSPNCKNGEHWVTPEKIDELKAKQRKRNKELKAKNPEAVTKRYRDWWSKNKEKARQACKNWYNRNKEKRKADWQKWYRNNPNRSKESYRKNSDTIKKRLASKRKSDPVYALKIIIRNRIKHAFAKKSLPKNGDSDDIIKCSWGHLKTHIEGLFLNGMTWENKGKWHIDHIVPLSIASTEEDVKTLNHWTNIRPLWGKDNLSKGAKLPHSLPEYIDEAVAALWFAAVSNNRVLSVDEAFQKPCSELPRFESLQHLYTAECRIGEP